MDRIQRLKSLVGKKGTHLQIHSCEDAYEKVTILAVGKNYIEFFDEENESNVVAKLKDLDIFTFEDTAEKEEESEDETCDECGESKDDCECKEED